MYIYLNIWENQKCSKPPTSYSITYYFRPFHAEIYVPMATLQASVGSHHLFDTWPKNTWFPAKSHSQIEGSSISSFFNLSELLSIICMYIYIYMYIYI